MYGIFSVLWGSGAWLEDTCVNISVSHLFFGTDSSVIYTLGLTLRLQKYNIKQVALRTFICICLLLPPTCPSGKTILRSQERTILNQEGSSLHSRPSKYLKSYWINIQMENHQMRL
jgi:hypothetical protein